MKLELEMLDIKDIQLAKKKLHETFYSTAGCASIAENVILQS